MTFQKLAPIYIRDAETLAEISELSFSACRCFSAFLFPGSHTFSLIIYSRVFLSPLVCLLLIWSLVFIPLSDNFFGPVSCMRVMPFLSASMEALMGSKGGRLFLPPFNKQVSASRTLSKALLVKQRHWQLQQIQGCDFIGWRKRMCVCFGLCVNCCSFLCFCL